MILFDFSIYAERRKAAKAVVEASTDFNKPGSVVELKQKVKTWFTLHQQVTKKRA